MRIFAIALCLCLNGCFFVYVPGSVLDKITGNDGNACIGAAAKVGDRLRMPNGQMGTVTEVHEGASSRCQQMEHPTLATVKGD